MRPTLDTELSRTAWRIGIQAAVLVILCIAAVGALVYATVVRSQERQTTQILSAAVASAGMGGRDHDRDRDQDADGQRTGNVLIAVLHDGKVDPTGVLPAGLPDETVMVAVAQTGVTDRRTVHLSSGGYDVLTVRRDDTVVQAAVNLFDQHQERERILGALAIGGGVGVALSAIVAALLAHRAVQPMANALSLQRRFVADAGHELRTPLTLLSTRAQLLRRRIRSGSEPLTHDLTVRDLDGMVADTRALTDILEELLLAADTRTPVPHEPVDLTGLVTDAVSAAQAAAVARNIELTLDPSGSASLAAGAPTALKRAVTALIDNALSHCEHQVRVGIQQRGSQIAIEVSDDGPGISNTTLPHLFHRFSSDRDQSTDTVRHYGLGLSLVSEIATRHGGSVQATNRTDGEHGAVLTLILPR